MITQLPIETTRLRLQKESIQDFDRYFLMSKDPDVMKYIGDGNIFHWTKDVAFEKFGQAISPEKENDIRALSVYRKDGSQYIGWCSVKYSKFLDHMELGYRYLKDSWGRGYATEAAFILLKEIFNKTDITDIHSCIHPDNKASIKVLEKLGFNYSHSKFSRPIAKDIFVFTIDSMVLRTSIR